jgi:hypothetical protein
MPDYAKVFNYEAEGLSYTVSLYEENGEFFADISVVEGAMDVNAVYFGDDDFSGDSASLDGPLNMNGTRLEGDKIQWDDAAALSDPGLGSEGEDKETYLSDGDTLTVSLDVDSLEDIDIFGIRATSTTTDAGSIKGVSTDPEEPEVPEEPEDPTYSKIFFGEEFSDTGAPLGGTYILDEEPDPNPYNNIALPEGTEPTFENYLSYFDTDEVYGEVTSIESIIFYGDGADGEPEELFRIDAPEGGFQDADEVLMAYDDALEGLSASGDESGQELMAALSLEPDAESDAGASEEAAMDEDELDMV